jgi:hypothetical protein
VRKDRGDSPAAYILMGIAVGVTLMLAAIFASSPYARDSHDGHATENQTQTNTEHNDAPETLWQKTIAEPVAFYTFVLSIFTAVLATVAIAQIRYLARSDETARIAADAAKSANDINVRSVIADQRAWIILEGFAITEPPTDKGNYVEMAVQVRWKNVGKVPALLCKTKMGVTFVYANAPSLVAGLAISERAAHSMMHTRYMAPGKGYKRGWGFPVDKITLEKAKTGIPAIYGVITYISSIDMSLHQTGFVIHVWKSDPTDREKFIDLLDFARANSPIQEIGWDGGFAN